MYSTAHLVLTTLAHLVGGKIELRLVSCDGNMHKNSRSWLFSTVVVDVCALVDDGGSVASAVSLLLSRLSLLLLLLLLVLFLSSYAVAAVSSLLLLLFSS